MTHQHFLHAGVLAQTLQHAFHRIPGLLEQGFPGVLLGSGHVIVGMVSRHQHQRNQHHPAGVGFLHQLQHVFHRGFSLHSAHKIVNITLIPQFVLQLLIGIVGSVFRAMAHIDNGGVLAIFFGVLRQNGNQGIIVPVQSQQCPANLDGTELLRKFRHFFQHVVVFTAGNHMSRLNHHIPDAVMHQPLQGLAHIVNFQSVTLFQNVQDHLTGKSPAHLIIRVCRLQSRLHGANGQLPGFGVTGAKGNHQQNRLGIELGHKLFRSFRCSIFRQ